jgi:4-hydroxy-tetrahydrodipicolinate synthase
MIKNKNNSITSLPGRRDFIKTGAALGMSMFASGLSHAAPTNQIVQAANSPLPLPVRGSIKQWASQNLRGGEAFIMPSFTPDFKSIDEEGIRNDVRHSIAQKLCAVYILAHGVTENDARRIQNIVRDEAQSKIYLVGKIPTRNPDIDQAHKQLASSKDGGVSHGLASAPSGMSSQIEIYRHMKAVIEGSEIGVVLYARPTEDLKRFDPTGLPLDAFDKLADMDQVVAVKFTQLLRPATAYALSERLGDRLLLGVVDLELMLPLSLKYPMQWTGQWGIDSLQSPEQPWVSQFLNLLSKGKNKEAYDLYWHYEPVTSAFYDLQAPSLSIGGHPWVHIKYLKWLTGGNGGLLADYNLPEKYVPSLDQAGRDRCREAFEKVGIATTDRPDEAFAVGNAAYDRGVRISDLSMLPQYIA